MPWEAAIQNAMRIARKYADGGFLDPKPMGPEQRFRAAPQKSPNQRVGEGHQEFEKGYARGWDWNDGPDYPVGIKNMRGQDLQLRRAADGGAVDPYTTQLTPEEEKEFLAWKQQNAPRDSGYDYDLRGAYKAGFSPDPATAHWDDRFKKPNHPTFSNQSQYAPMAPERAGTWTGDVYNPPYSAGFADGGGLQRTEPFPEKPEGYEFYGPDDGPGDAPTESVPLPKSRPRQSAEYTAGSEGMLSYDPAQEPPRKGPPAIMEPDLQSAQTGQLPEGLDPEKYMIGEGNIILDRETWEPVQFTKRSNVLPWTTTPQGDVEANVPKMFDIAGNMGGGWSVPVRGTEAILGAGAAIPRRIRRIDLDEFFKSASPSEVEHLSDAQLSSLDSQLRRAGPQWVDYADQNPDLFEALQTRLKEPKEKLKPGPQDDVPESGIPDDRTVVRNIANSLLREYGHDGTALAYALDGMRQNGYYQEFIDQVFDALPQNVRYSIKTHDVYADKPQQRNFSNLDELERAYEQTVGRTGDRTSAPQIANGERIDTRSFFGNYGIPDVARLTDEQLFHLRDDILNHQANDSGTWSNIWNYQPELVGNILARARERQAATRRPDPEIGSILEALGAQGYLGQPRSNAPRPAPVAPVPPGPFRNISRDFMDYFNRLVAPHTKNVDEFAKTYFAGMDTSEISASIGHDYIYGNTGLRLAGTLKTPDGKMIGTTERLIFPQQKYAYHGFFRVNHDMRGKGYAPQILRSQIDLYKKMGLTHAKLHASLESGPYAWAKYGWIPDKASWNEIRRKTLNEINRDYIHITDPVTKSAITKILQSENPRTMWDLVDFKGVDKDGHPIGGLAVLGNEWKGAPSSLASKKPWDGSLMLNDPSVMERFDSYVKRDTKKKPK